VQYGPVQCYTNSSDCSEILRAQPGSSSGVYTIVIGSTNRSVQVYCDMTTNAGGWTVFQSRQDGSVDFYRNWTNYALGFGSLLGEFWIGNDIVSKITPFKRYVLRVDMIDWSGNVSYAEYDNFTLAGANDRYKLTSLGHYTGNARDSGT